MKQKLLNSFRLKATLLVAVLCALFTGTAWAETVTYTVSSTSAVSTSGTAPSGSSASYSSTYSTACQLTKNNSMTLTLSGYEGYKITGITLSMKSNSKGGSGNLSVTAGTTDIASISTAAFNTPSWYGSWSTSYVDIDVSMDDDSYEIQDGENVVITIAATANSLYCQSFTLTYEEVTGGSSDLTPNDLELNETSKEFDLADGAGQTFQLTNSGSADGSLSYESNNTAVATVSDAGLITAVGEGTAKITVTQAASSTYAGGSATCTVTVTDSRYSVSDLTFTSACGGSGTANDGAGWTVTSDGTESVYDGTSGIHYGTNSANVTYLQLATSDINGQVGKVVVNARDAQATATITVTVGGVAFTCTGSATATNTSTDYTFMGTGSGEIVVRVDRGSSMSKAIYVKSVKVSYMPSTDPSISASNVDLLYNATNGSIAYTLENEVTGGELTAEILEGGTIANLALGTITSSAVSFTCDANSEATAKTATVRLTYTYNTNETVTKDVTVTQDSAPVIYTTIPALFDAATSIGSTASDVNVTFGNWVVSGVNGSNAFVTDNNGNGFIIYTSNHGFAVNDKLVGTVSETPLKLYNGSAEFTNLTSSTSGLTVTNDGEIAVITNKTISELGGVNTGAVITLSNLTYDGTNLSDGSYTIKPYNTLYNSMNLISGRKYNITGVYQQFSTTKEILPRSAADIVEVQDPSVVPTSTSVNVTAAAANGTINVSYNNFTLDAADIVWYESDGTTSATYAWLTASINADNNIEYNIQANVSTEERKAYFKVYALDSEANEVYSELITVTQAGYVPDYANLPFSFDGGKSEIETTNGLTQSGLDTDYNDSPKLKFKTTGSYVILEIQGGTPAILTFDIKGNSFSGGTFTVQTSTDGSNYNTPPLAEFTELGNSVQTRGYNIGAAVTHIKWIYTEKVTGNVALGNIKLASSEISVSDACFTTYTTQSDVSFPSGVTAYKATQVNTNTIHLESVDNVPAGTPLVIQAAEGTYTLNYSSSATTITDNILLSSDGSVKGDGSTKWALAKFEDEVGFNVVGNDVTIPAGKAYLNIPSTPGVKAFLSFDFSDADGIQAIEKNQEPMANGQIFNLAGQRLSKMQKGINIVNGKKVLVK